MQDHLETFFGALNTVCAKWQETGGKNWGFNITIETESVQRAHSLWQDLLTENNGFPPNPGPFKCAAAYLVAAKAEINFRFQCLEGAEPLTADQENLWKTRFLYKSLPLMLRQWGMDKGGNLVKLEKYWCSPTPHFRLDFLNLYRWTELPVDGPPNPPPPSKPSINFLRTNRLIMALALIIEATYYQTGNIIKCDVMGHATLQLDKLHEDIQPDLYFDTSFYPGK